MTFHTYIFNLIIKNISNPKMSDIWLWLIPSFQYPYPCCVPLFVFFSAVPLLHFVSPFFLLLHRSTAELPEPFLFSSWSSFFFLPLTTQIATPKPPDLDANRHSTADRDGERRSHNTVTVPLQIAAATNHCRLRFRPPTSAGETEHLSLCTVKTALECERWRPLYFPSAQPQNASLVFHFISISCYGTWQKLFLFFLCKPTKMDKIILVISN